MRQEQATHKLVESNRYQKTQNLTRSKHRVRAPLEILWHGTRFSIYNAEHHLTWCFKVEYSGHDLDGVHVLLRPPTSPGVLPEMQVGEQSNLERSTAVEPKAIVLGLRRFQPDRRRRVRFAKKSDGWWWLEENIEKNEGQDGEMRKQLFHN